MTDDAPHARFRAPVGRRRFLAGLTGTAATLATTPAWAQFGFSFGGSDSPGFSMGNGMFSGLMNLFEGMSLGEEDEIRMGNQLYGGFIARGGGPYRNRRIQTAMRNFAEPILATSKRKKFMWEIVVLEDNTVNAWALPGGKLAVNRGLLRYVDDESELAAVIAHEVAHAELGHVIQQMRTEQFAKGISSLGADLLAQQTGGRLNSQMISMLAGPLFEMVTSGYSPEKELEADDHILKVFAQTGHDPAKAPNFFYTLLELIPPEAQGTTSLFSTHPGTWKRIRRLEKKIASIQRSPGPAPNRGFQEIKATFPTRRYYRRNPRPAGPPSGSVSTSSTGGASAGRDRQQYRMER